MNPGSMQFVNDLRCFDYITSEAADAFAEDKRMITDRQQSRVREKNPWFTAVVTMHYESTFICISLRYVSGRIPIMFKKTREQYDALENPAAAAATVMDLPSLRSRHTRSILLWLTSFVSVVFLSDLSI